MIRLAPNGYEALNRLKLLHDFMSENPIEMYSWVHDFMYAKANAKVL